MKYDLDNSVLITFKFLKQIVKNNTELIFVQRRT